MGGFEMRPEIDEMLMMHPDPRTRIPGCTACMHRIAPK
jgi:hypothetical protein